jgi:ribonuclease HI
VTGPTPRNSGLPEVTIYTDGACIGNPGPGGVGVVVLQDGERKEIAQGYSRTTNNRMELLAAILGLESLLRPSRVTLSSDSTYLTEFISNGQAAKWKSIGWKPTPKSKKTILNADLWDRLLGICDRHEVDWRWVKGHAGNPENERCDELATSAARGGDLLEDANYLTGAMETVRKERGQPGLFGDGT